MTHLIWAGVIVYLTERILRWVDARRAPVAHDEDPPIPDDLMALAMSETETWAQEDVLRVIREKYRDYKDWNLVRRGMGIARMGK